MQKNKNTKTNTQTGLSFLSLDQKTIYTFSRLPSQPINEIC